MSEFIVNGRFLNQPHTGVQRYGRTVLKGLEMPEDRVMMPSKSGRLEGIIWEQWRLRASLAEKGSPLLVNLCNTAPYDYAHQLVTVHDMATFDHPEWFSRTFALYYRWLLPRIIKYSEHVVTVSDFSKARILDHLGISEDRVSVISPSVDQALLKSEVKPISGLSSPFILMVGSPDPRKRLVEASIILQPFLERFGINLVIAGRTIGPFRDQRLSLSSRVVQHNDVTDGELKWLYQHAALVVQPSLYEGFSMVPLEALAFGRQVVVSNIQVHREVYGNSVHYFDSADLRSLEETVQTALDSDLEPHDLFERYSANKPQEQWRSLIRSHA